MSAPDYRDVSDAVAQPPSVRIVRDGDEETLSFRWAQPEHVALIVFAVIAGVFFTALLNAVRQKMDWGLLTAAIVAGVAEVGLIWAALAGLVNRTYVTICPESLWVRHGPIPVRHRGRVYSRNELRQLYVQKIEGSEDGPDHFRLIAETTAGEHITLTRLTLGSRVPDMSYIAWRTNRWLLEKPIDLR